MSRCWETWSQLHTWGVQPRGLVQSSVLPAMHLQSVDLLPGTSAGTTRKVLRQSERDTRGNREREPEEAVR